MTSSGGDETKGRLSFKRRQLLWEKGKGEGLGRVCPASITRARSESGNVRARERRQEQVGEEAKQKKELEEDLKKYNGKTSDAIGKKGYSEGKGGRP